jgi:hypothetical protein
MPDRPSNLGPASVKMSLLMLAFECGTVESMRSGMRSSCFEMRYRFTFEFTLYVLK